MPHYNSRIPDLLREHEQELLANWVSEQRSALTGRSDLINESELNAQCKEFMGLLRSAVESGNLEGAQGPGWAELRDMLADVSRSRALRGFTPTETALFVLSLKKPLFAQLQKEKFDSLDALAVELWIATSLLDGLGLWTTEVHLASRQEVIVRQQQELLELSTPVVKLWDGVLAVPLIGTLDSARTQVVMEALLQRIVDTGSELAIIDITGVPTVDTVTAQHLLKAVAAARLMGADCIISGIRPQIAQTIVHLGVDLSMVTTKATMAEALRTAMQRLGLAVVRLDNRVDGRIENKR